MAETRECHAVLWDLHGAFVERKEDQPLFGPLASKAFWATCAERALRTAGMSDEQLRSGRLDPLGFWRKRMALELSMPRERAGGKIIPERRFQERVNTALLEWVAPAFMSGLGEREQVRLARMLRRLRRRDNAQHTLYSDMRELARWIVEDLVLPVYLLTAQSRRRTNHLLESCRAPRGLFLHVYTSTEVGWPKSHQKFWRTVRERVDVAPHQAVCIEDSLSIGANALRSGMALILVDRDGASRAFIEQELGGHLANAPLLQVGERFPVEEPFVVCARSPKEIQRCIQAMRYVPREGR